MKRQVNFILLLTFSLTLFSQQNQSNQIETSFMVFSDPHYYDPSLGTEGEAFQNYLDQDRKLLKESRDLMLEAIRMINSSGVDFVLISGDLTKDGSRVSHEAFAKLISKIEASGISVFVIPGNHDILNGDARKFENDTSMVVENIDPALFKEIYADYGYKEAIYADKNSLSYVVEPVEGLWILCLDPCLYRENHPGNHPVTDGEFQQSTLDWVNEIAVSARAKNKQMFVMMHHGIIEHYKGQEKHYGEYVVNDYKNVSKQFAENGIKIVFTGHYHAQDISVKKWKDGSFIFDVETGSLVTYPCPLRKVSVEKGNMEIHSSFIQKTRQQPEDFTSYSRQYVHNGIAGIAEETLVNYKLKRESAQKLSGQIADAFIAHYRGDEIRPDKYIDTRGVGLYGKIIILVKKSLIVGLYNDLEPSDNDLIIDLETGDTEVPGK